MDSRTGDIYLNDFNRCRFLPKRDLLPAADAPTRSGNATILEACPVYIPSAPGASRSPEEYDLGPLTEKLDVYSAGNILYGIITGVRPWNGDRGKHVKTAIQRGDRPPVNATAQGSVDAELARLLDRTYERDPAARASAKEIVAALEALLDRELGRVVLPENVDSEGVDEDAPEADTSPEED